MEEPKLSKAEEQVHYDAIRTIIDSLLFRTTKYISWQQLPPAKRKEWGRAAKEWLENPISIHLFGQREANGELTNGKIVQQTIEYVARDSHSHLETQALRLFLAANERVREDVEMMLVIDSPDQKDGVNDTI